MFPRLIPGNYRLKYDLSVRKGAGLNYEKVDCGWRIPGMMPAGSEIQILEVKYLSVSVWGRFKKGWICMYMNETAYVEAESVN